MNLEINLSGVDFTPGESIANLIYEENGIFWVDIENLKPNPLNKIIYANDTAETTKVKELAVSMRGEMDTGNPPNIAAIGVYPDGMID